AFSNFAQIQNWPGGTEFAGRFVGNKIDFTTYTLNPSLAIRPLPWLSFGFGLDLVPAGLDLRRALNFGGAEGGVHAQASAFRVGGIRVPLVRVVRRWLDFAFSYRSAVQFDCKGHALLAVPPELAALASPLQNAKTSVTLPHNFAFALATHPAPTLHLDFDVHV